DRGLSCRGLIGQGHMVGMAVAEFFMLGADAPFLARLFTRGDIFGQLCGVFDRAAALLGNGHRWPLVCLCVSQVASAASQVKRVRAGLVQTVWIVGLSGPSAAASRPISIPGR